MKKLFSIILAIILVFSLGINTYAVTDTSNTPSNETTIYFEDGSYIIVTIAEDTNQTSTYATHVKTGSKSMTYYSSDEEPLWGATLRGTFTYTGTSATCTDSSISYSVYDSNWKVKSATTSETGNKALGNIIVKRYFLGITTKTVDCDIQITCSATGVLS
ncbi:MAG: hypothetical protein IKY78_08160 [Clostridia bacterium]|nr:hypothetical protein [Clostridia bacterium]